MRYFDGKAWTANYAPFTPPPAGAVQPATPGMSRGKKIGLGVLAGFLALIVIGNLGESEQDKSSPSRSSGTARPAAAAPAQTETAVLPPAPVQPPKPSFTASQENAIDKAESYLRFAGFSRSGLIEQLEYSQFSTADATFAVENLEASGSVDWNEQAIKKAKSYLEFTSFSLQGLVEQLEYSGFTPTEAQYGANAAYGS